MLHHIYFINAPRPTAPARLPRPKLSVASSAGGGTKRGRDEADPSVPSGTVEGLDTVRRRLNYN